MEEEHYDTPWEYKSRFLNALKPRPFSSTNIMPSCSTTPTQEVDRDQQHKSMVIRTNEYCFTPSPPNGKLLKKSPNFKDEASRKHPDRAAANDYPFVKNVSLAPKTGGGRTSLSNALFKKLSKLNEVDLIHDNVDRLEAEHLLMPRPIGEFLLRKRQEGNLALSLRATEGVLHIKLERKDNNAWVLGEGPQFPSISGCLKYYYRTALPIRGSEHVLLKAPVPVASPVH